MAEIVAGQATSRCTATSRPFSASMYTVTLAVNVPGSEVLGDEAGSSSPYGTALGSRASGAPWAPTPQPASPAPRAANAATVPAARAAADARLGTIGHHH